MPDYSICATAPNKLYTNARELFATAQLDWTSGNWAAALLSAAYVPNIDTHKNVSDLTGVLATSSFLQNKTAIGGFLKSDTITFAALDTGGVPITQIVFYKDLASDPASLLVVHISDAFGLPVIGLGDDLILSSDASFGGWVRL